MTRNKLLVPFLALMLCVGALFFSTPAYASGDSDVENLTVDSVWLEGEILHIEVTDKQTGINQTLELSLTDYAGNSEYVSVQAVDNNGNKSNTINFINPFYTPESESNPDDPAAADPTQGTIPPESQSGVPDGSKPLTPDGTGTVTDNVTDGDGKEFFTITTEDGNVFYMIIDRQRESENVYLLNTVTEDDLAALAEKSNGTSGGVPNGQTPSTSQNQPPASTTTPEPETTEPPSADKSGTNNGTIIFIVIAAVVVGGVGYYFKILRPKKDAAGIADEGEEYEDDYDDSDEYGGDGEDE